MHQEVHKSSVDFQLRYQTLLIVAFLNTVRSSSTCVGHASAFTDFLAPPGQSRSTGSFSDCQQTNRTCLSRGEMRVISGLVPNGFPSWTDPLDHEKRASTGAWYTKDATATGVVDHRGISCKKVPLTGPAKAACDRNFESTKLQLVSFAPLSIVSVFFLCVCVSNASTHHSANLLFFRPWMENSHVSIPLWERYINFKNEVVNTKRIIALFLLQSVGGSV